MKVYTVHEPTSGGGADRVDRAQRFEFVSDGFDWNAALFAPLVLLAGRMYAGLAIYAVAVGAAVAVLSAIGAEPEWIALAIAAIHVIIGFEYGELRRAKLDADGWSDLGPVSGKTLAECERRFFETWLPSQPLIAPTIPKPAPAPVSPQAAPTPTDAPSPPRPTGWRAQLPWPLYTKQHKS